MTGRILVVDDVEPNVRLLEAKLTLEYYDVLTAMSGHEALEIATRESLDLIILDVMMPGIDGFEVCHQLRAMPKTRLTPIILVTALDGREDKVKGLQAGADDYITKPIDDVVLFSLVRKHVRAQSGLDSLLVLRGDRSPSSSDRPGRVVIVEPHSRAGQILLDAFPHHQVEAAATPTDALRLAGSADLVLLPISSGEIDGLRLLAQMKADGRTRRTPILGYADPTDRPRWVKALEIGVDGLVASPLDPLELVVRADALITRKRQFDAMLAAEAVTPPPPTAEEFTDLEQRPAPHLFASSGGKIQVSEAQARPVDVPMATDVFRAVRGKVDVALEALIGNHADPRLNQSMTVFRDCISVDPSEVRGGTLLMAYRSLQADASAYLNPASEREAAVSAHVVDVSLSAADLIVLYPRLREIEDARLALEITQPSAVRDEITAIVDAAAASSAVAPEAIAALQDLVEATSPIADNELAFSQEAVLSYRAKTEVGIGLQLLSIRNFCAAAFKALLAEGKSIGAESLKEARAAIPKAVGEGVGSVVKGGFILALAALASAVVGPILTIATVALAFRPIAARAEQIRKALAPPEE